MNLYKVNSVTNVEILYKIRMSCKIITSIDIIDRLNKGNTDYIATVAVA